MITTEKSNYFKYLFDLQASGRTNMFGAGAYLEDAFDLDKREAKEIVLEWMQGYDRIAKELGIDV